MDLSFLTAREQSEVKFALVYRDYFEHGTDGHSRLIVIAKLADKLEQLQTEVMNTVKEQKETREFMD